MVVAGEVAREDAADVFFLDAAGFFVSVFFAGAAFFTGATFLVVLGYGRVYRMEMDSMPWNVPVHQVRNHQRKRTKQNCFRFPQRRLPTHQTTTFFAANK
jgi:hypothetical protein